MIKGTTSTGFQFEVDPDVPRDMIFIGLLAKAMEDGTKLEPVLDNALGVKQREALYDHVRKPSGRVLLDDINREFLEILDALKENPQTKN
jgi:hypothetical protein